jgi:hypothetical protein
MAIKPFETSAVIARLVVLSLLSLGIFSRGFAQAEKGFPSYDELRLKVKHGLAVYGMQGVGEGKNSEGSDWIVKVLETPDDRPVWVTVWGGTATLAQALWTIRKTKSPAEAERLYKKLRVYTISDQDDSGPWIRRAARIPMEIR